MPKTKYAFRCRNCGHLEEAGAAGERRVPAACRYCGKGVAFDPDTGIKAYVESNWIVLAELPEKELKPILKFHGITAADIGRHKPLPAATPDREPQLLERTADEALGVEDNAG